MRTCLSNRVGNMTGQQVGAHFWGMAIDYDQLEWARVEYKVTGYPLEELQEGWRNIEKSFEEYMEKDDDENGDCCSSDAGDACPFPSLRTES